MSDDAIEKIIWSKLDEADTSGDIEYLLASGNYIQEAAAQIRQYMLDEVIGKDDYMVKPSGNSRLDQSIATKIEGQNELREGQRQKLK